MSQKPQHMNLSASSRAFIKPALFDSRGRNIETAKSRMPVVRDWRTGAKK